MSLVSRLKYLQKLGADNAPLLLTAVGVGGVITTAVLAVKATRRADHKLEKHIKEKYDGRVDLPSNLELARVAWTCYIPPVVSGATTIGCIVMANRIGTKRAAALAAAYTVSERAYTEYKDKVVKILGESEEQDLRDEIAQDRIDANPNSKLVIIDGDEVLCFDSFSGRYFKSTMETIRKAQNDINEQILNNEYASLSDFYKKLQIDETSMSDEVGWSNDKLLEVTFGTALTKDGKPCLAIDFSVLPMRNYWQKG